MNLFMHWAWAGIFRVTWAISACTYGAKFQRFCERRLRLGSSNIITAEHLRIDAKDKREVTPVEPMDGQLLEAVIKQYLNPYEIKKALEHIEANDDAPRDCYGFYLTVQNPLTETDGIRFCFGFALTTKSDDAVQIDYFRIQDHLRQMGLGRRAMEELVDEIIKEQHAKTMTKTVKGKDRLPNAKHTVLASIALSQWTEKRPELEKGRQKLQNLLASVVTEIGSS